MIDHDYMRRKNLSLTFECIRASADRQYTKRDIQRITGLSWATVSGSIAELLKRDLIVEVQSDDAQKIGRPAKRHDINARRNLLIGVDINIESLQVVLVDLKCRVIHARSSMTVENERDKVLAATKRLIREVIDGAGVSLADCMGIGFALMSAVNAQEGIAIYSQHFANWRNVHIKEIFEREFGLPVLVEHDPNCLAIAEMNIGQGQRFKNVVYLRISLGIGMSTIIDGAIYKGSNGASGEFGHICMDVDGPMCSCGKRGCVEAYASISGIASRHREDIKKQPGYEGIRDRSVDGDLAIVHRIAKAAMNNDAQAQAYFDRAAQALGIGISNLITVLNPDIVLIGGIFTEYADLFLERTKDIIGRMCWEYANVNLAMSSLGYNAAAIGAAALFIQTNAWEDLLNEEAQGDNIG